MENAASAAEYALPVMLQLSQRQPTPKIVGQPIGNATGNRTTGEGCSTWQKVGREKNWHVDSYLLFPYLSALPCAASRSHRYPLTEALSCFVYFLLALITPATQRN